MNRYTGSVIYCILTFFTANHASQQEPYISLPPLELGLRPFDTLIHNTNGNTILIEQFPVYGQGNSDGGGAASCAYHAIKNGIGLMTNNSSMLTEQSFIQKYFQNKESLWRSIIIDNITAQAVADYMAKGEIFAEEFGDDTEVAVLEFVKSKGGDIRLDGEWLDSHQIENLLQSLYKDPVYKPLQNHITIIPTTELNRMDPQLKQKITHIKSSLALGQQHILIIGTMTTDKNPSGHWFAMVIENNNPVTTYKIADSKELGTTSRIKATPFLDGNVANILTLTEGSTVIEALKDQQRPQLLAEIETRLAILSTQLQRTQTLDPTSPLVWEFNEKKEQYEQLTTTNPTKYDEMWQMILRKTGQAEQAEETPANLAEATDLQALIREIEASNPPDKEELIQQIMLQMGS